MSRSEWIVINKVPSYISTWGHWIEDEILEDSVLIFITGNPGVTDFYFTFLSKLQTLLQIPIWTICHAGQMVPPKKLNLPSLVENPQLYNLSGQIEQKRTFIKRFVPKSKNIYLLGHSVGAKICIELLKDEEIASRTKQVHLLFPTLQHIRETPNGKLFTNLIQYLIPVLIALAWLFSCLPKKFCYCLLAAYFWVRRDWPPEQNCIEGALRFFTPTSVQASLFLAQNEMKIIKELDSEIYDNQGEKIYCYYAVNDWWAPLHQCDDIAKKHVKVKCKVLEDKFTHAFVLKTSVEMAELLFKQIKYCDSL